MVTSKIFDDKFNAMSKDELKNHVYALREKIDETKERYEKKMEKLEFEEICARELYLRKYGSKQ